MTSNTLNIVFMGTPEFASVCLDTIIKSNHCVVGVVTAPDRQSGRGRKISESEVKRLAIKNNLPLAQPEKLKSPEFHKTLKSWNADLFVVVAFRMLPEVVWAMPPKGTINLHASLLPQFRGAAPIQRAIMQGASESGATIFRLAHKIDTGNILQNVKLEIGPNENAGSLHNRILNAGKKLLVESLDSIAESNDIETPQSELIDGELLEAPKIFKEDRRIDWNKKTLEVHNQIRGLCPYPGAFTTVPGGENTPYKILVSQPAELMLDAGMIKMESNRMYVGTSNGSLEILRIQPAGKSAMEARSFVLGLRNELTQFS